MTDAASSTLEPPTPEPSPTEAATEIVAPTNEPTAEPYPTLTTSPQPTEEILTTAYVAWTDGQGLGCMAAPSWNADPITVLPDGTAVTQIGIPVDGWQMVACGDGRGYADAAFLSPEPVVMEPTVPVVNQENAAEPPVNIVESPAAIAPQTFTFALAAETSILRASPDVPQSGVSGPTLALGGPDGGIVALTFQVSGIADGTVVQATLYVTEAGEASGGGGTVLAVPGVSIDPWSATAPGIDGLDGFEIGWLDGVTPGVQTAVDVSGVVTNGTITFVLTGTDSPVSIAAGQSLLVVTGEPGG
ncbi:MAG: hypothetical protein QM589_02345 [Thermomicrobiales bacterium]